MSFLLDTDTCSFHLRKRVQLTSRVIQYSGRLSIATISLGESTLQQRGQVVPAADLMIGCVALAHDLTLVTHNTKDFVLVPGLRLDDWIPI